MKTNNIIITSCYILMNFMCNAQNISGVINSYAKVSSVSAQNVTVTSTAGFSVTNKVLVIQMKGCSITTSNTSAYGTINSYNNAGNYETAIIQNIAGNVITFQNPLARPYTSGGLMQL